MKQLISKEKETILLRDFNLHHFYWSESTRSTQHAATDRLLNIVKTNNLQLTLSRDIITWKTRRFCSTIDLTFMSDSLMLDVKHCMIKSNMSQFSNHISVSTKLQLICERILFSRKRAWKLIDMKKIRNEKWRASISSSLNIVKKIDAYTKKIQTFLNKMIDTAVSWAKSCMKTKSFWNSKCDRETKTTRRLRRVWSTSRNLNDWKTYLTFNDRKQKTIIKTKKLYFRL